MSTTAGARMRPLSMRGIGRFNLHPTHLPEIIALCLQVLIQPPKGVACRRGQTFLAQKRPAGGLDCGDGRTTCRDSRRGLATSLGIAFPWIAVSARK